jgi:hypothetical protein
VCVEPSSLRERWFHFYAARNHFLIEINRLNCLADLLCNNPMAARGSARNSRLNKKPKRNKLRGKKRCAMSIVADADV